MRKGGSRRTDTWVVGNEGESKDWGGGGGRGGIEVDPHGSSGEGGEGSKKLAVEQRKHEVAQVVTLSLLFLFCRCSLGREAEKHHAAYG